jgi:hypothetical protein
VSYSLYRGQDEALIRRANNMTNNVDWFVAATGMRGDGLRERPFHDP